MAIKPSNMLQPYFAALRGQPRVCRLSSVPGEGHGARMLPPAAPGARNLPRPHQRHARDARFTRREMRYYAGQAGIGAATRTADAIADRGGNTIRTFERSLPRVRR